MKRTTLALALFAVLAVLAVASPGAAASDLPIPVQLESFTIPALNEAGQKINAPVSLFIEVGEEEDVKTVCRAIPRLKDAINITINLNPISVRDGRLDLGGVDAPLLKAVSAVIEGGAVRKVHLIQGKRRIGKNTAIFKMAGLPRGCQALEDYPPDIGVTQFRVALEEAEEAEKRRKKDWFKPTGPPPPPPKMTALPHPAKTAEKNEGSLGLGFWLGVVVGFVVVAAAGGGGAYFLLGTKKKPDRRSRKKRRGEGERRKARGEEKVSEEKRKGDQRRAGRQRRGEGERRKSSDRRASDRRGGKEKGGK